MTAILYTAHAARSDGFDPGLLDGLEHRPRLLAAGHELSMHRRIMTSEPKRDEIGVTAYDGGLPIAEPARRLRQSHFVGG